MSQGFDSTSLLSEFQNKLRKIQETEKNELQTKHEKEIARLTKQYEDKIENLKTQLQNTNGEAAKLREEKEDVEQENKNLKFLIQQTQKQLSLSMKTLSLPVKSKQFATLYKLAREGSTEGRSSFGSSTPTTPSSPSGGRT